MLAPESCQVTTFSTHLGLRRYKRLNFGISSAAEVFQDIIRGVLSGLEGVLNVSDDILVHAPTMEEHLTRLKAVFQLLRESGLTLHKEKCEFLKSEVWFFWYRFSDAGVGPDKVKEIQSAPSPTTVTGVRSFLGMVTYCGQFMQNLTDLTKPLRELTKSTSPWVWVSKQEQAFQKTKAALSENTTLMYFDPRKESELAVDSSPTGLEAVLSQRQECGNWAPVAYASRTLTPTEQQYSHIEKEAIAVHWGCRHFHL